MQCTLVIGLGALLAITLASVSLFLNRSFEWVEQPRDSSLLEQTAEDLQFELDRLHARYVDRLDELVGEVWRARGNTFGPERTASDILGVRSVSFLPLREGEDPIHFEILDSSFPEPPFEAERFPILAFERGQKEEVRGIDRSEIEASEAESGWMRAPSNVLYYWRKLGDAGVALVGIDGRSVRWAITDWLEIERSCPIIEFRQVAANSPG